VSTLAAKNSELVVLWQHIFPGRPVPIDIPVHPTPLYETGMLWIGFGALWAIRKRMEIRPGWMFGVYLITAGLERFLAEFWRINPRVLFGLTEAQVTAVLQVMIGGGILYWATYRSEVAAAEANPSVPPPPRKPKKRRR